MGYGVVFGYGDKYNLSDMLGAGALAPLRKLTARVVPTDRG